MVETRFTSSVAPCTSGSSSPKIVRATSLNRCVGPVAKT